jgi:hypothetical protein
MEEIVRAMQPAARHGALMQVTESEDLKQLGAVR